MKTSMVVSAAIAALCLCTNALAESSEERNACMGDAMKTCWSAIPDHHAVYLCLYQNQSRLSEGCRAIISKTTPYGSERAELRRMRTRTKATDAYAREN